MVVGTDDGLIHITEDGGSTWTKIDNIPEVPNRTYVNAVLCSKHDDNTLYAAFNHHKYGDFKPYIFKSIDRGLSWTNISNNLPERGSVYSIEEDHVDSGLLFCGTEFGVFFSPNNGNRWKQIKSGVPTVAVRDIAIQERENDLVLGTFGRGFYVLDNYSVLRNVDEGEMAEKAEIFDIRSALMFEQSTPLGLKGKAFMGDSYYTGDDLGPLVLIDYYYSEKESSLRDQRRKKDKEDATDKNDNPYPSYDELLAEDREMGAKLIFSISDADGNVIRKIQKGAKKGIQRLKWGMRYASKDPINLSKPSFYNPFAGSSEGTLVEPGQYSVSMSRIYNGETTQLAGPVNFEVKALNNTVMPAEDRASKVAFQREIAEFSRSIQGAQHMMREIGNKMRHIKEAINQVEQPIDELLEEYYAANQKMAEIRIVLSENNIKSRLDIDQIPSPSTRVGWIEYEQKYSTSSPTGTHIMSLAIAKEEFEPILNLIKELATKDIDSLEQKLEDADAPYTPGRALKMID